VCQQNMPANTQEHGLPILILRLRTLFLSNHLKVTIEEILQTVQNALPNFHPLAKVPKYMKFIFLPSSTSSTKTTLMKNSFHLSFLESVPSH